MDANTVAQQVEELFAAPNLPQLLDELNSRWQAEQAQRHVFWDAVRADQKAEFINGEGIYHSPAMLRHVLIASNLLGLLIPYVQANKLGRVGSEKAMVRFTRNDYEPDIVFWRRDVIEAVSLTESVLPIPNFVVEILSNSTSKRDRGVKFEDYARHGIQEYWMIDPELQSIEQYLLQGSSYALHSQDGIGILTAVAVPGFTIDRQSLFR